MLTRLRKMIGLLFLIYRKYAAGNWYSPSRFLLVGNLLALIVLPKISKKFVGKARGGLFQYRDKTFKLFFPDRAALGSFEETFMHGEYEDVDIKDPSIIFDLGANVGVTALYFHIQYPNAKIFAFEPSPEVFTFLSLNTKDVSNIDCYPYAIGAVDKTATLHVNNRSSLSSSLKMRQGEDDIVEVSVIEKSLDTLINELQISHIDLLKFDIEGAEFDVLSSFQNKHIVSMYVGEIHLDLVEQQLDDFEELLDGFSCSFEVLNSRRYMLLATKNTIS